MWHLLNWFHTWIGSLTSRPCQGVKWRAWVDYGAEFRCELILMNVVVDVITDCWMLSFIWFIRLWLLPIQSNTRPRPLQRINHHLQWESILNTKYPFSLEIFPVSRFMFCLKFSCYWKYEVLNLSIVIWQQHFTCPPYKGGNKMALRDFFIGPPSDLLKIYTLGENTEHLNIQQVSKTLSWAGSGLKSFRFR